MAAHLRRLLIGTSFLCCLATLGLWGRSYFAGDLIELHRRGDLRGRPHDDIHGVCSSRGSIGAGYVHIGHPGVPGFNDGWQYTAAALGPIPWPTRFSLLGFSYWNTTLPRPQTGPVYVVGFEAPHALFATLLAIAPTIAARRFYLDRRRRHRIAANLCIACGYDVRATAQRCPECGTVPDPASPTAP